MQQPDWRGDPILDGATRVRGTVVACRRRELVDDPVRYRSEVANVVARTAGIDPHLVSWFRRDGADEQISGIALHRAWGDRDFNERDKQILLLFTSELYRLYKRGDLDVTRHVETSGDDDARLPALSPRQREVLTRLLAGDSLKQVAQRLGVTRHTVDEHVGIIYRKFGVNSRAELLARLVSGGRAERRSDA
jgi:DNA-binding CsgD family transcriptional regulator